MEGSLWALIRPIILCHFPFDILLRTLFLCCHVTLFPRSLVASQRIAGEETTLLCDTQ